MKRQRKKYETPRHPWDKARLEAEKKLMKDFGLKNKKEIWKAEALLRKNRGLARDLIGKQNKEKEKILIDKLVKLGILVKDAMLDNVLGLTVEDFLNRRLQTVIMKKTLANTVKQARQFITHGQVMIDSRRVTYPSYMIPVDEEEKIVMKISPIKKMVSETNGGTTE